MPTMAALIMAAGQASRFGSCKQLAMVHGQPLLQRSIDHANRLCPGQVFVVSGAWHNELSAAIRNGTMKNATLIFHSEWVNGLGSSIARGVEFLSPLADSIMIVLADQIALTTEILLRLHSHFDGTNIVCSVYGGRRGVPAIFGRKNFPDLQELRSDRGAQALLYRPDIPIVEYPWEEASIDIDTPEDLQMWEQSVHKTHLPTV